MPKPKEYTATLVGLFLFVGLVILGLLILRFGKIHRGHESNYTLNFTFSDATGILEGSDVRLGGAKVGRVASTPQLTPTFDRVVVTVEIREGFGIPRNAEITTAGAGLLGDKYISISVPSGTDPAKVGYFKDGETAEGISAGSLTSLQVKVEELSTKASGALTDIQGGVTRITVAVDEFEKVARNVNTAIGKFNDGILSDANLGDFRTSMGNLRKTSENLSTATEKLAPVLDKGSKAMDDLDATLAEIRGVFREIKPVAENVKANVDRIGNAAESLDRGVKRITAGDGLLPALINDRDLKAEFHALIANLRRRGLIFYRDEAEGGNRREGRDPSRPTNPRSMFP